MIPDTAQVSPPRSTRRRHWTPWLLLAAFIGVYLFMNRPVPPPEGWGNDYAAGLAEARANHRRILLDFYMEGCGPCKMMDRSVLPDKQVRKAMDGYARVRLDVFKQPAIADRFGVFATPTYAVVDENERLIAKVEGYFPAEDFIRFLSDARSASPLPPPQQGTLSPTPTEALPDDSPTG